MTDTQDYPFKAGDHPLARASAVCLLCGGGKPIGPVLCCTCYRDNALEYGDPDAVVRVSLLELELERCPVHRTHAMNLIDRGFYDDEEMEQPATHHRLECFFCGALDRTEKAAQPCPWGEGYR